MTDDERRKTAEAWLEGAGKKRAEGDVDGAMADYSMAMTVDASWAKPCFERGSFRFELGRIAEAADDLTRAIRLDPGYVRAYAKRAVAYLAQREYAGAENDLSVALEAAPGHAKLLALRVEARLGTERGWDALDDANALVEAAPSDPASLYWRGLALEAVGDAAGAERDLRAASEAGSFDARKILRQRYGGV